jgi:hypothetical protein
MRRRELLAGTVAAFGAATAVLARRRRREHVALHYEDGSMMALERGAQRAEGVFAAASEALAAARGGP